MTFQTYQRLVRLNRAIRLLNENGDIASTAFDVGYESSADSRARSGRRLQKSFGKQGDVDCECCAAYHSSRADVRGSLERGLCLLEFTDRRMLETEFEILKRRAESFSREIAIFTIRCSVNRRVFPRRTENLQYSSRSDRK